MKGYGLALCGTLYQALQHLKDRGINIIKQAINRYEFHHAFETTRPDNFSYEGLNVLFDYLEQYEEDTGEELELDVVALCCDFSEDTDANIASNYRIDISACTDEEEIHETVREYLMDEGADIGEVSGGFVYRNF